jgi:succinate-acetate transporter protein
MTTDATRRPDGKAPPADPPAEPTPGARVAGPTNTPPLCLIAFAVITFMFSLLNAGAVPQAVVPIIIATGLIFGGITQLSAALIQIASGDTLNGALFSTFASFWIVLPAFLEWFSKAVPSGQIGHATGLLLYTFAIVAAMFLLVSLRTNVATLLALGNLVVTLVLLGVGNYGDYMVPVRIGGVTGIILAAQALYLAAAGICQYAYGRTVIPLGHLGTR